MAEIKLREPDDLKTLDDIEMDLLYWQTLEVLGNLQAQAEMIRFEAQERLTERKRDSIQIGDTIYSKYIQVSATGVDVEKAREFAATKMEEKVNTALLIKLHKSGVKIDGIKESIRMRIAKQKPKEESA